MNRPQWALRTARTQYVVSLTADARSVVLDHWGAPLEAVPRYEQPERVLSHITETDALPVEYTSDGQRHTAFTELRVDRAGAGTGAIWTFDPSAQVRTDAGGDELVLTA